MLSFAQKREQLRDHEERVQRLEAELEDHRRHPPERSAKSLSIQNYKEKDVYLHYEVMIRLFCLLGNSGIDPVSSQSSLYGNISTWSDKVRELIAVKVLHTSLLNTTVVAFRVLPMGSYAPMPAPSPTFKTILELVLWNGLQSFHCFTLDVINVIKMPSFLYFLYLREQKKVTGG